MKPTLKSSNNVRNTNGFDCLLDVSASQWWCRHGTVMFTCNQWNLLILIATNDVSVAVAWDCFWECRLWDVRMWDCDVHVSYSDPKNLSQFQKYYISKLKIIVDYHLEIFHVCESEFEILKFQIWITKTKVSHIINLVGASPWLQQIM